MDEGACCGSCEHARRVAAGEAVHPASPVLRIDAGGWIVARHRSETVRVALRPGQKLVIGRASDCEVALPGDPALSRRTCSVEVTEHGDVFVEDLQSTCGTFVNGKTVQRSGLHELDEIRVGSSVITFERG